MVYCAKCGTKNDDSVSYCTNCGAALYPDQAKETKYRRVRREEECFGLPHGGAIAGLVFGAIIIIVGLGILLGRDIWEYVWPSIIIIVGILVVAGALRRFGRGKS